VITRRSFFAISALLGARTVFAQNPAEMQAVAAQRKADMQEAIRKVIGDATVRPGKVKLDIAPLIDNGNAVAMSVSVESPMTEKDHVKAIHVFTEKNPQPYVLSVHLGPRAGRARVATRVRLADTQTVHAIAQLSDGSFWSGTADVVVTLAACLEEGLI
jgi:sulfur-oxidizing protein SoxY